MHKIEADKIEIIKTAKKKETEFSSLAFPVCSYYETFSHWKRFERGKRFPVVCDILLLP